MQYGVVVNVLENQPEGRGLKTTVWQLMVLFSVLKCFKIVHNNYYNGVALNKLL
jgi:hypothetical protein